MVDGTKCFHASGRRAVPARASEEAVRSAARRALKSVEAYSALSRNPGKAKAWNRSESPPVDQPLVLGSDTPASRGKDYFRGGD